MNKKEIKDNSKGARSMAQDDEMKRILKQQSVLMDAVTYLMDKVVSMDRAANGGIYDDKAVRPLTRKRNTPMFVTMRRDKK